jgi:hypothetical protein
MKIAILLPGHLRAWEFCKNNFMENLYDANHDIDIFVDTYYELYRTDTEQFNRDKLRIFKTKEEIKSLFDGLNVVSFEIEEVPEFVDGYEKVDAHILQRRKISKVFETMMNYEDKNTKYDLVIRSRFDITVRDKLNYEDILNSCNQNDKMIMIGNGGVNHPYNDMFAISTSQNMRLYGKRFDLYPCVHDSFPRMESTYGTILNRQISINRVTVDDNGNHVLN